MNHREQNFSISKRLRSFKFAISGLKHLIATQHNARIHLLAAILTMLLGWLFQISVMEWCLISLAIAVVFAAESFNTSIEYLTDLLSPELREKAGRVKDLAAAAVLICALGSLTLGLIIFLPKIVHLF